MIEGLYDILNVKMSEILKWTIKSNEYPTRYIYTHDNYKDDDIIEMTFDDEWIDLCETYYEND